MLVFNAQSIRNKMDSLRALMVVEKPEIVGITESWISTDTTDFEGEFEILGYSLPSSKYLIYIIYIYISGFVHFQ